MVVIAGPTGVGKTALALKLAKHYKTVIVSADSRQFYRELSIGTAKPDATQLQQVSHYQISNKSITELYGAGHYEKEVIPLLNELYKTHDLIFLVGGSGLYIDAVLNGVDDFSEIPKHIREALNAGFVEQGLLWLQEQLKEADPNYYEQVDLKNSQRIIRALEVIRFTGLPYSSFLKKKKNERNFFPIKILITTPRNQLYDQINLRVEHMMQQGLLEEVKGLQHQKTNNALKTVGYKELFDYLEGVCSLEVAVDKIKQHTRNYAKRQLTWFKNKDRFVEFGPEEDDKIIDYLDKHHE